MPPVLSVIVPTHDTRDLTLRCLASVLEAPQLAEADGLELILVDDGSRDGTAEEAAHRHPEIALLRHAQAQGFTRSANDGLRAARGEILLLLNSDTEVAPGSLARLIAAFAAAPRLGVAGAALFYPDGRPQWSGGAEPGLAWLFALGSGLPALLGRLPGYRRRLRPLEAAARTAPGWVTGAAMAIRRAAWAEVAPLDEGFRFYAQDLDVCVRARQAGWDIALLPEVRVLHHHGATIGKREGALAGQHLALLWGDLLRWARKHRGERWARWAGRALSAGAALRRAGLLLALLNPFLGPPVRDRFREERRALADGLAALRSP
jgi:N-acetylglucosaminyl-diphospho-decaprenol L-rhamnosyltransferase